MELNLYMLSHCEKRSVDEAILSLNRHAEKIASSFACGSFLAMTHFHTLSSFSSAFTYATVGGLLLKSLATSIGKWAPPSRTYQRLSKTCTVNSYTMRVVIEGEVQSNGMVMDFFDLKKIVQPLVEKFGSCVPLHRNR